MYLNTWLYEPVTETNQARAKTDGTCVKGRSARVTVSSTFRTMPREMTYPKCNISEMLHFGYVISLGIRRPKRPKDERDAKDDIPLVGRSIAPCATLSTP